MQSKQLNRIIFCLCIVFFIVSYVIGTFYKDTRYYQNKVQSFSETLFKKQEIAKNALSKLLHDIKASPLEVKQALYGLKATKSKKLEANGIFLYVYINDSLLYWSGVQTPIPEIDSVNNNSQLIHTKNGWYLPVKLSNKVYSGLALVLLKHAYFIQNKFLQNRFQQDFKTNDKWTISKATIDGSYPIILPQRGIVGHLYPPEASMHTLRFPILTAVFLFLAIIFFVLWLWQLKNAPVFIKYNILHMFLFFIIIAGMRILMLYLQWPAFIYQFHLFSPGVFAASWWLPSLGDFIINAILFTVFVGLIFTNYSRLLVYKSKIRWVRYLSILIIGILNALSVFGLQWLISRLIIDSSLPLKLNNLLALDLYGFLGYLLIILLLLNYLVISDFFAKILVRSRYVRLFETLLLILVPFIGIFLLRYANGNRAYIECFLPYVIFASVYFTNYKAKNKFSFYSYLPVILLFTALSTFVLFKYNKIKEQRFRMLIAVKAIERKDRVAEYLFEKIAPLIKRDTLIKLALRENGIYQSSAFFDRIARKYFSGYWAKYALVITPFSNAELMAVNNTNSESRLLKYYEKAIKNKGNVQSTNQLYYIENNAAKVNYLAKLPINTDQNDSTAEFYIYTEFISKALTQATGFPDLLLDASVVQPANLSGYAYAIYKNNGLIISGGNYGFPIRNINLKGKKGNFVFVNRNHFNHLIYTQKDGLSIIISKKRLTWLAFLNPFAYLLLFFALLVLLFFVYRFFFHNKNRTLKYNFRTRIQLSLLAILLISLIVTGIGIYNYVYQEFNRKNKMALTEKLNSILIELNNTLQSYNVSLKEKDNLNFLLKNLSSVFYTDINLYDTKGFLIASSRPSIYNEGLLSRQMAPAAFYNLNIKLLPYYIHKENIGQFVYLSAYSAYQSPDNQIVAYVNLPYFWGQKELKQEISASLLALLNIYSLLITLAMAVTFIIANQLTGPLKMLQEKISKMRLGKQNEPIKYTKNDEIGSLVTEYNRMIGELEASAKLLAQSERESAWKEMAKQVAHEVKNPLTPMKLSVQYLLKAWEDKKPDFNARIRKFRTAMIEQIDTLSVIASEFSYFAKMPTTQTKEIDLVELLESCISFYKGAEKYYSITFASENIKKAPIFGDKDQILRVFNNLIRNAIFAIQAKQGQAGIIQVTLSKAGNNAKVEVYDNGTGIAEDIQDKIFTPNFTTKSEGMGLGLAMAKAIIESFNGNIYYKTLVGEGTAFFVELPLLK